MAKAQYVLLRGVVRKLKPEADRAAFIKKMKDEGHACEACNSPPTEATLMKYSNDGIAKATDGCRVEPDGTCTHGHKSWLLQLGFI